MRTMLVFAGLIFSLALTPAFAVTEDIGPVVGATIPTTSSLQDHTGQSSAIGRVSGKNGIVVAFVRSAAWCPYCQVQLKDLQSIQDALDERGFTLASVSYDDPMTLDLFRQKNGITYAMLSDKKSELIDAFGIRDPQYKQSSIAFGVPRPAIFIVDRMGVVKAKLIEDGYKIRPSPVDILKAIDAL